MRPLRHGLRQAAVLAPCNHSHVGHWLKSRWEMLVDVMIVFVVMHWLPIVALSAVLYLLSSTLGTFGLVFAILWLLNVMIKKIPVPGVIFPGPRQDGLCRIWESRIRLCRWIQSFAVMPLRHA